MTQLPSPEAQILTELIIQAPTPLKLEIIKFLRSEAWKDDEVCTELANKIEKLVELDKMVN